MTFADKLSRLRKENNYTQEQLAGVLGVSRQAVSKWESGLAFPETDKIIHISKLFDCSLDYLLKDKQTESGSNAADIRGEDGKGATFTFRIKYPTEKKSDRLVFGMPLYHIGKKARGFIAIGADAKGVIAVGLLARGIVSFGLLSVGVLAIGLLAFGLLAAGSFALGVLSAGAVCVGLVSAGAISIGVFSVGAVAIGDFSVGAFAIGKYAALGDKARAMIAIGDTEAEGALFRKLGDLTADETKEIMEMLDIHVPVWLGWAKRWFSRIIR